MRFNTNSPFVRGMRDGIPIALGYYAVAFSLGIIAGHTGMPWWLGFGSSFFTRASAGEYGVYSLIAAYATFSEVAGISLVANLRYLLMSTALTQKFRPGTSLLKRILVACCITDEVFAISIAYPGYLAATYTFGAMLCAGTLWAAGTASGILAGNILPGSIVSAMSVALYGMFLAIVIPTAKRERTILWVIIASFAASGLWSVLPYLCQTGTGTRTILLTILISAAAAIIKPVKE